MRLEIYQMRISASLSRTFEVAAGRGYEKARRLSRTPAVTRWPQRSIEISRERIVARGHEVLPREQGVELALASEPPSRCRKATGVKVVQEIKPQRQLLRLKFQLCGIREDKESDLLSQFFLTAR
jgi:hypothetical protein